MRNLSALLAFTVLSLGMVACQTNPMTVNAPQDPPSSLPPTSANSFPDEIGVPTASSSGLHPLAICPGKTVYYGRYGCGQWYYHIYEYTWPYGYGQADCWFINFDKNLNTWSNWVPRNSYSLCNNS